MTSLLLSARYKDLRVHAFKETEGEPWERARSYCGLHERHELWRNVGWRDDVTCRSCVRFLRLGVWPGCTYRGIASKECGRLDDHTHVLG